MVNNVKIFKKRKGVYTLKQTLYSYCVKGNVSEAYEYLQSIESSKSVENLKKKYYNRFFTENPIFRYKTKDKWIKAVIKAYYEYFVLVLTNKTNINNAENLLLSQLVNLLSESKSLNDINLAEEKLSQEFKSRGFYFLGGITPPFRGPYIWRTEEKVEYEVTLPDRTKKVVVYFMSDFIMQSWLHFATFGGRAAGGWALKDALYCVKDRYEKDLDKPDFLYSYLAHEAQHLADYEDFPSLMPTDLEYRAKLVELIYHPLNAKVLMKKFLLDADNNNRNNPHPYANYIICANLSKRIFSLDYVSELDKWTKIDSQTISNLAAELLQTHTFLLNENGKEIVKSVI